MLGCYQMIAILIRVMERTRAECEGLVLAVAGAEQGRHGGLTCKPLTPRISLGEEDMAQQSVTAEILLLNMG